MNTEQLMTLCQRHHALLLASDTEMISIAVVGNPASELMEALRFATQKRIDIECWTAERMEKRLQSLSSSHLPGIVPNSAADVLSTTLQQAVNQRALTSILNRLSTATRSVCESTVFSTRNRRFPPPSVRRLPHA